MRGIAWAKAVLALTARTVNVSRKAYAKIGAEFNPDQIVRETTYGEPFDDGWSDPGDELFMDEVYPD